MNAPRARRDRDLPRQGFARYRHPRLQFRLDLPEGWTALVDRWPGIALLAREPVRRRLRTNLVVVAEPVPADMPESHWHQRIDAGLGEYLPRFRLLDREAGSVDGVSMLRRLATHRLWDSDEPLTFDQCVLVDEGIAYTLTLTAHTLLYPDQAALFERIRATFRVGLA